MLRVLSVFGKLAEEYCSGCGLGLTIFTRY